MRRRHAPNPRDYDSADDYREAVEDFYAEDDDCLDYEDREAEVADRVRKGR